MKNILNIEYKGFTGQVSFQDEDEPLCSVPFGSYMCYSYGPYKGEVYQFCYQTEVGEKEKEAVRAFTEVFFDKIEKLHK